MELKSKKQIVYSNPWFRIIKLFQSNKDPSEYFILSRNPGVICLIFDENGNIILVRQDRIPLSRKTIEMPAGAIDKNETALGAVKREVLEETGYSCDSYYLLSKARLMINREDVIEYFFVGFNAKQNLQYNKTEDIETIKFTKEDLRDYIISGKFDQTVALGALFEAEQKFNFKLFHNNAIEIERKINYFNKINNKI
jgi:ADP-ribose pyrophosphatase